MFPSKEALTAMALLAMNLQVVSLISEVFSGLFRKSIWPTVQSVHTQSSPSAVPPLISLKVVQDGT